ncbi:hypothetical protein SPRG_21828 [Saprolegnia parasitica CBS 223.65]|uniref:PX domain-containing protein n=1 Tax=Saprolegnia parasitica (strain CBS 223.65) TaxID=695850 RepID=A0A067BTB9_SAPPC|nr:hypothetical protein SPRG_21828 [Saprolegnia parasitica CBS 223.65]KDO17531.1 hypothetical protein SPRG_21828 [Saprolegnia parasitica CBS 223.65]|eukprot:XP_012211760.1 hypothetical protein SPRG_21828 [Saprolegnia parasitica CBS 223.65]
MALNQLLHRKSRLTRRRASSIRTMRNVEVPRYEVLRSSKTTVYITTVDNGTDYWELPIRYSKYHDFFTTLCKTDKKWVAKLPFPEKSFGFGKDSPDFRRRQLDLFMRQLNALFTSLSAEGQDVVMDFLEAKHHVYHYEREASIYDHYDDEKASRRGYKSSVASDTDCEDNSSEHNIDGLSSPSIAALLCALLKPRQYATTETDVAYDGHNASVVAPMSLDGCTSLCTRLGSTCQVYVWHNLSSNATCIIKDSVGVRRAVPGAVTTRRYPLSLRRSSRAIIRFGSSEGPHPLPTVAYSYVHGALWLDEAKAATVGWPQHTFTYVESIGECAQLATTVSQPLFSYSTTSRVCSVVEYDAANQPTRPSYMRMQDGRDVLFENIPAAFLVATAATSLASLAECAAACAGNQFGCVGYHLERDGRCHLVAPTMQPLRSSMAGWVPAPMRHHLTVDGRRYVTMRGYRFSESTHSVVPAASLEDCAMATARGNRSVFAYTASSGSCAVVPLQQRSAILALRDYPKVPAQFLHAGLPLDTITSMSVDSAATCAIHSLCSISRNECVATSFEPSTGHCTLLKATRSLDPVVTLGWLPPTTLPTTMTAMTKAAFFVTAHQDDHELFMSGPFLSSLGERGTKTISVYLTAGDLYTMLAWPARERATLMGTQAAVEYHGLYHPVPVTTNVTIGTHVVTKVTIGNGVHYFLRLPESGAHHFLNASLANRTSREWLSPVDKPDEFYSSYDEVRAVVQGLMEREAAGMAELAFHTSEPIPSHVVQDHTLHRLSGELTASIVSSHRTWSACAHVQFYYGYQKWEAAADLDPSTAAFQRHVWMREFAGVMNLKNTTTGWDFHAKQLGRMDISRAILPTIASCT